MFADYLLLIQNVIKKKLQEEKVNDNMYSYLTNGNSNLTYNYVSIYTFKGK